MMKELKPNLARQRTVGSGVLSSKESTPLDEIVAEEQEQIKGYLGPFMERLSVLSEEYETEKASLERGMFATLSDKSNATRNAIVEAEFNKRMLVNVVEEYQKSAHTVVVEGIQARRNSEQRFASKLLTATHNEFQSVISSMREEDRKKIIYAREENKHKLDNCRIAMGADGTAQMLRQQANTEVQHKKVIMDIEIKFANFKKELDKRASDAELKASVAETQREKAELSLKILTARQAAECEKLKEDISSFKEENDQLMINLNDSAVKIQSLTEELEETRADYLKMETRKNAEIKDLRKEINQAADAARKREAKLVERVEQYKKEAMSANANLLSAQNETRKMEAQNEKLRTQINELKETLESERQVWEANLSEKVVEIERLTLELNMTSSRVQKLEVQLEQSELTCKKQEKDLSDTTARLFDTTEKLSKANNLVQNVQADISTWIMDVNLAKKNDSDLEFRGAPHACLMEEEEPQGDPHVLAAVTSDKSMHLVQLLSIASGHFAGLYCSADERHEVVDFLLTGEESFSRKGSVETEKPGKVEPTSITSSGGKKKPLIQQLSEATQRVKELEIQVADLEETAGSNLSKMQAEWRAKCISLAQRLEKTEVRRVKDPFEMKIIFLHENEFRRSIIFTCHIQRAFETLILHTDVQHAF
jgi:hypothetical protein